MHHETVTFNLAAIQSRTESLHEVILSLLPQADAINVYLNEFKSVPEFLYHPKIQYYKSQDEAGDLGDAGKFYKVSTLQGYIFTVDDDLIYPRDYAETMIRNIERFKRRAVVTCHGRIFHSGRPVQSIYTDFAEVFGCVKYTHEAFIHFPGTGVTAFHSDTCRPPLNIFKASNMADVWLALFCQKKKIPIFCIQHPAKWIRESQKHDRHYTIWNFCHADDSFQTEQINSIKNWKLHACEDTLHHTGL